MSNQRFVTFASVISEIEQSSLFMTVKARILETPKANLNGARVTEAFVDDIIANEERYVGLPLYADIKALKDGKYNRLGHLYDSKTGEFHSTQIGSFYQFEKEEFKGGFYLVGYARIPKRDKDLSKALAELFAEGKLKFSFEISCGEYTELDDGTFTIDASENNFLEGTAIVTFPACEDAVALEFVAQRIADERGDKEMAEEREVVAEETQVETATPQEVVEACDKTEDAACKDKTENAAVYVTESHNESISTCTYDTKTDKEVCEGINVYTTVTTREEGNLVETDDGIHIAEEQPAEPAEVQAEEAVQVAEDTPGAEATENPAEDTDGDETETDNAPVQPNDDAKQVLETLASLAKAVEVLTAEVKEMKEAQKQHVTASQVITAESINPFVDTMPTKGQKYDLLEIETPTNNYTLLS